MRTSRLAARRLTLGLLLVLALVAACTQTPAAGDSVQRRLADALLAQGDPADATLVEDAATTVQVVRADWLPGWQVLDVLNRGVPHGRRFFVGLAEDGRVEWLAGQPDAFAAMVTAAGVTVVDPSTAIAVAQLQVDATRTFEHYAYRIERVADIDWLPQPTAAEQAARRRLTRAYGSTVRPPEARAEADAWRLVLWTVDDRALVEHTVTVTRSSQVSDAVRTVEPQLPVPSSR